MTTMRTTLQTILENFQVSVGETPHVYFEPPESVKMIYPCFVYHFIGYDRMVGDNGGYELRSERYTVSYITKKADPVLAKSISHLPRVMFDTHYTADNLHHYVFVFNSQFKAVEPSINLKDTASSFLGGNNG